MAVKIRLMRIGKRMSPKYRIIVIEEHKKRNSSYIEKVGFYDPSLTKDAVTVDNDRVKYWLSVGAQFSFGLRKLIGKKY
ncbi:MAG: 30S ribosomal protein S16 [Patescibacteria group bacterium]|jgi:small subunit ribosomal protein S16